MPCKSTGRETADFETDQRRRGGAGRLPHTHGPEKDEHGAVG